MGSDLAAFFQHFVLPWSLFTLPILLAIALLVVLVVQSRVVEPGDEPEA